MRYFHFYCKYAKWGLWDEYLKASEGITKPELDEQLEIYVKKHYKPHPQIGKTEFDLIEDAIFHSEYDEVSKEEFDKLITNS